MSYTESATLRASRIIKERKKKGLPVYNGGLGANPIRQAQVLINTLKEHSDKKEYLSANGLEEFSQMIKKYYSSENYSVANTIVVNGLKELIFLLLFAFQGTTYLVRPSWVSYEEQLKILNKPYKSIITKMENNFKLTPELLKLNLGNEKNKLLILNNPTNPTGAVYSKEELKKIAEICKKNNIIVFADEIYLDLTFERDYTESFSKYYKKTIIGCSLSKTFCCGGYRIGWFTFTSELEDLYRKIFIYATSISSCASHPFQLVGLKALEKNEEIIKHINKQIEIYKYVGNFVYNKIKEIGLESSKPESAWYTFISFERFKNKLLERDIKNSEELTSRLINDIGLVTVAGLAFGYPGFYLRYSFIDLNLNDFNIEKIDPKQIININILKKINKGFNLLKEWLE